MKLAAIAVDQALAPLEAIEIKLRFREQDATRASVRKNHYSRGLWAQKALAPRDAAMAFAEFLRRSAITRIGTRDDVCRAINLRRNAARSAEVVRNMAATKHAQVQVRSLRLSSPSTMPIQGRLTA